MTTAEPGRGGFDGLAEQTQLGLLRRAAHLALGAYNINVATLRLVKFSFNAVYRVVATDGQAYVLRLAVDSDARPAELESEMQWIEALKRDTGLKTQVPIRRDDGNFVTPVLLGRLTQGAVTVLTWMPGLALRKDPRPEYLAEAGRITAVLHEHSAGWAPPPGFIRPAWDIDWLVGPESVLTRGIDWVSPDLNEEIRSAAGDVASALREYGRASDVFGMTHADLHAGNLVEDNGVLAIIDFDDCSYCYYLHDLAVMVNVLRQFERDDVLEKAYLNGYREVRPFPRGFDELLDVFLVFRDLLNIKSVAEARTFRVLRWREEWLGQSVSKLREFTKRRLS